MTQGDAAGTPRGQLSMVQSGEHGNAQESAAQKQQCWESTKEERFHFLKDEQGHSPEAPRCLLMADSL